MVLNILYYSRCPGVCSIKTSKASKFTSTTRSTAVVIFVRLYILRLGDPVQLKRCYLIKIATDYIFKVSFDISPDAVDPRLGLLKRSKAYVSEPKLFYLHFTGEKNVQNVDMECRRQVFSLFSKSFEWRVNHEREPSYYAAVRLGIHSHMIWFPLWMFTFDNVVTWQTSWHLICLHLIFSDKCS